ncbi:MAG: nitroreductase [Micavibrio sp.]|nr:nitroreductase [Micavibrio sp.]
MSIISAKPSPELLDYLLKRRSVKVLNLSEPAPSEEALHTILTAAARVSDHGKMVPFYFLVFEGDTRKRVGDIIADSFVRANPEAREDQIKKERMRFARAPMVVALISRIRKGKNPQWEQVLTAGAAAQNFSLACHASGFGVNWLTEWYAYDEGVKAALGLDNRDHVVGFFHVGTPTQLEEDRERPDLEKVVTYWHEGVEINKGDAEYDKEKFILPVAGFTPPKE